MIFFSCPYLIYCSKLERSHSSTVSRLLQNCKALFGWARNGWDQGPISMDHPGEETISAHVKLYVRLSPNVNFSPAHHGVSLCCLPGKKSPTLQRSGKIPREERRRNEDPDAMAGAARSGGAQLSPPAATFSPRWEHCSWVTETHGGISAKQTLAFNL
uniref:Uncharacterized protein n=1 Tax=Oryza barthii TaxID=65489 RepID=A0A0D3GEM9_9ORYZ